MEEISEQTLAECKDRLQKALHPDEDVSSTCSALPELVKCVEEELAVLRKPCRPESVVESYERYMNSWLE